MGRGLVDSISGAFAAVRRGVNKVSDFFSKRYGIGKKEQLALLAAPAAVLASPLLGLAVAGAMVAPHLMQCRKDQRKQQLQEEIKQQLIDSGEVVPAQPQVPKPAEGAAVAAPTVSEQEAQKKIKEMASAARNIARAAEEKDMIIAEQQAIVDAQAAELQLLKLALQQQQGVDLPPEAVEAAVGAQRAAHAQSNAIRGAVNKARDGDSQTGEPSKKKRSPKKRAPMAAARSTEEVVAELSLDESMNADTEEAESAYLRKREQARAMRAEHGVKDGYFSLNEQQIDHFMSGASNGYEYRSIGNGAKKNVQPGSRMFIYGNGDVGHVVGYCDVQEVITGSVDEVWEQIKDRDDWPSDVWTKQHIEANCKKGNVTVMKTANTRKLPQPKHGTKDFELDPMNWAGYGNPSSGNPKAVAAYKELNRIADQNDFALARANGGQYPTTHSEPLSQAEKKKIKKRAQLLKKNPSVEWSEVAV